MDAENKKSILIVEDEPSLRKVLVEKFQSEGYEVFEATDGKQGLETALSQQPDLTLLDVVMPVMDGLTMLKSLREDAWGKQAKVIMLTNLGDSEGVAESAKNGVFDYLIKTDWKIDDLFELVKSKL